MTRFNKEKSGFLNRDFSRPFWADRAVLEVVKISAILVKYPFFEGFFHISMGKTNTKLEFLYIVLH